MIGNDLVDLNTAKRQSNWRRKGYLDKIFSLSEQEQIKNSTFQDQLVWTFWSMKEAAYKMYNRESGIRNFAPTKLECTIQNNDDNLSGSVHIDHYIYCTLTKINDEFLHTIAATNLMALDNILISIYKRPFHPADYKRSNPGCVSHHGEYLALVY